MLIVYKVVITLFQSENNETFTFKLPYYVQKYVGYDYDKLSLTLTIWNQSNKILFCTKHGIQMT